jgi:inner membrane protein
MTGRTHDLAAFTALGYVVATQPLSEFSLATGLVAVAANLIGGLAPDIDQPSATFWYRMPAGSVISRILYPLLGGHRFISHSIIGVIGFGIALKAFLTAISGVLLVDMEILWWAFMIGFISHLFMDMLTHDGVPWLFPIPIKFGFPPFKFLRMKTGGMMEKSVVFPGLMLVNVWIYYSYYDKFLEMLRNYLK